MASAKGRAGLVHGSGLHSLFHDSDTRTLTIFHLLGPGDFQAFRDQWLHPREESEVERESRGPWTGPVRRWQRDGGREP